MFKIWRFTLKNNTFIHSHHSHPLAKTSKLTKVHGVLCLTAAILIFTGLVFQGCGGGGGGGSLPGAVTETGTLTGQITLPNGIDPSGALVVATRMASDKKKPASINNTLNLDFDGGYTPTHGHTFTIVQNATGGITGSFENLTHNLGADWTLSQTVNADNIVITLDQAPLD